MLCVMTDLYKEQFVICEKNLSFCFNGYVRKNKSYWIPVAIYRALKNKLEFQLALETSSSQSFLALGKS